MRHRVPLDFYTLEQLFVMTGWDLGVSQRETKRVPIVLSGQHSLDILPLEISE